MSSAIKNFTKKIFPILFKTTVSLLVLRATSFILPNAITSRINIISQGILALTSRCISIIFTGSSTNDLTKDSTRLISEKENLEHLIRETQLNLASTRIKLGEALIKASEKEYARSLAVQQLGEAVRQASKRGVEQERQEKELEINSLKKDFR